MKIRYWKLLVMFFVLGMILSACSMKSSKENTVQESSQKATSKKEQKIEISLENAVNLAQKEASSYYKNLKLTEVHSYDNDELRKSDAGADGKRQWWNVNFANESSNYVSVLIADGKIVDIQHFDDNGNTGLFDLSELKMTTSKAIQKAKELGLRGGNPQKPEEWVSGYNYKLSYASLASKPDKKRLFLEIIGISAKGNFAHVDFDGATGQVLLSEEQIIGENGKKTWQKMTKNQ